MSPKQAEILLLKARMAAKKGEAQQAIQLYRQVLGAMPNHARAKSALVQLTGVNGPAPVPAGKSAKPSPPLAELRRIVAICDAGDPQAALTLTLELAREYPDTPGLDAIMGTIYVALGRGAEAEAAYRRAIAAHPDMAELHSGLGDALREQEKLDGAIAAHARALELRPDLAKAHLNLGAAYYLNEQIDLALASYERAIALDPQMPEALTGRGDVLRKAGRLPEAVESYGRATAIKPRAAMAVSSRIHQMMHICDWRAIDEFDTVKDWLGIEDEPVSGFQLLSIDDDPERQRRRAEKWGETSYRQIADNAFVPPPARPARLKIGYFSADFHDHPVMHLMAGLFREHDRERFEIHIFSYGTTPGGPMREELIRNVHRFHDISRASDDDVVRLAREQQLDIAIDLMGPTGPTRTRMFQYRLAPIQMGYLGYPGTMGAPFLDYMIADPFVIPRSEREHYGEKIVFLPNTYLPADNRRPIAANPGTRADHGLPEKGFVFCSFNNSYKITPAEFDIWCRLLARVDGSVLWFSQNTPFVEANLRREAAARGVDPSRLIVAQRVAGNDQHLARLRHGDLFLDTFNYNAHTTASDALWAGLPIITKYGRSFASRVAASVLFAMRVPELAVRSTENYERLAFQLATDPRRMAAIRARMQAARDTTPLFDTPRFARDIEAGYDAAYAGFLAGLPPEDIRLT